MSRASKVIFIKFALSLISLLLFISCEKVGGDHSMQTTAPAMPLASPRPHAPMIGDIKLINIVPQSNSYEENQDSEPNLSVNPRNPAQIVASAFTPGPFQTDATFCQQGMSPIYISVNSGQSWALNCILPTFPSTFDITVRFGPVSGNLYAGILLNGSHTMQVLRTTKFTNSDLMQKILERKPFDQPYIEVAKVGNNETVFVGENNCCNVPIGALGKSANIDTSFNATSVAPAFNNTVVEKRTTLGWDLASVRIAIHQSDGVAYGVFMGQGKVAKDQKTRLTNVVVVRDDHGGKGSHPYTDLKEPSDGIAGRLVKTDLIMPAGTLGQQRLDGNSRVSIAVDPRPIQNYSIYVAWVDSDSSSNCLLHVWSSEDAGKTWTERRVVPGATNPAIAVNSDGVVGLLYQSFTPDQFWETHLEVTADKFANKEDAILSRTADSAILIQFDPYIGDYIHLLALDRSFYGIFSASNAPDKSKFPFLEKYPNALIYQRDADFNTHTLSYKPSPNGPPVSVNPSIDPFFIHVTINQPSSN
jgi:hypothetical protein